MWRRTYRFCRKVYDEVRYWPYDNDVVQIDEGDSPGGFLMGYICEFDDLKYEEPENGQKEFLRIAVSAVAALPNDIEDVEEHVGRHTHKIEKFLAQPLEEDEDEDEDEG